MAAVTTLQGGRVLGAHRGQAGAFSSNEYENDQENAQQPYAKTYTSSNQPSARGYSNITPPSSWHANGVSRNISNREQGETSEQNNGQAPQTPARSKPNVDSNYLSPFKNDLRPKLSDLSRSGSEADSLIDLYGQRRSGDNSIDRGDRAAAQEPDPPVVQHEDPERSRWIHRDKLALIESQEMQQAGIKIPLQERSNSRSKSRRNRSQDKEGNSHKLQEVEPLPTNNGARRRLQSPVRDEELVEDSAAFDLRTPEEIAADPYESSSPLYRQQGLRASSSRIPLPRSSPMPIPQQHLERNTPLPRQRGASGTWGSGGEEGIAYPRSRSHSVGSQVLLDDEALNDTPSRPMSRDALSTSPRKPRISSGASTDASPTHLRQPSTHSRNVSASQPLSKPRTTSYTKNASPITRPKSRNGIEPRPATAVNRPEGDPPWLATMYKPDPRLPPEEQILPTHAKRMQMEREASLSATNTPTSQKQTQPQTQTPTQGGPSQRAFSPVAVHTREGLQAAPELQKAQTPAPPSPISRMQNDEKALPRDDESGAGWPLRSMPPTKPSTAQSLSVNGSGEKNAGYSTIPRVRSEQQAPERGSSGVVHLDRAESKARMRSQGPCRCCVVM